MQGIFGMTMNYQGWKRLLVSGLFSSRASAWVMFIRLALAGVFIPEGVQKLLFPRALGAGRFLKMGIPYPDFTGPFVGYVEIVCGLCLLLGVCTRFACIPIITTMLVAIIATKVPIWMGHDWVLSDTLIFYVRELNTYGFWSFMHEARLDWAMLMGACYLLTVGAGPWSLDAKLAHLFTLSLTEQATKKY